MHILYALNENYVRHLAASLCSLCDNNKDAEEIVFHIISIDITEQSKQKLRQLAESYGRSVTFYEIGDIEKKLNADIDTKGFDISVLSRLFVGSCLPESVDRVLYLDCDTIIVDTIAPFYHMDMGNNLLAAVCEPVITKTRRPLLGMEPSERYFNSGVLLFQMQQWRAEGCEEQVLSYFLDHMDKLVASDQDAINACFKGRILAAAPKYNFGSYNLYYPYRLLKKLSGEAPYVSKEEYLDSKAHPAIIHYLGEERPWRVWNTHPYRKDYERYLSMTAWKEAPKEQGWKLYFLCFRIFNICTKPFPALRYRIIDSLIPAFMRHRAKQRKRTKK